MERQVTALVVPTIGAVVSIDAAPGTVLLDATGEPVEEVSEFFATMLACGASFSSLRSYGLALLRWWRFLAAIEVHWQRGSRIEHATSCCGCDWSAQQAGRAGTHQRRSTTPSLWSRCSTPTGSVQATVR